VEKFPVHFYEDGIDQFETTLKIRQTIAMAHWQRNTKYSFYDVLKQMIPGFGSMVQQQSEGVQTK